MRNISVWNDGLRISGVVVLVTHSDQYTPAVTSCNGTLRLNAEKIVILSGILSSEIKPFVVKNNVCEVHFFIIYHIRLTFPQNSLFVTICSVEFVNHIGLVWMYLMQFGCSSCWLTQTRSSVVQAGPNTYLEMSRI